MGDWRRLGCGFLIGAAVAFPAGVMVAGGNRQVEVRPAAAKGRPAARPMTRNVYSPEVLGDPYVIDQQRQVVEGLERQCRSVGENCAEAAAARRWLDEQTAD